jgi:hypothetical protein
MEIEAEIVIEKLRDAIIAARRRRERRTAIAKAVVKLEVVAGREDKSIPNVRG